MAQRPEASPGTVPDPSIELSVTQEAPVNAPQSREPLQHPEPVPLEGDIEMGIGITEISPGGRPPYCGLFSSEGAGDLSTSEVGSPISAERLQRGLSSCLCGEGVTNESRLGRLPLRTTVGEVDVLAVLPGVDKIEERQPLIRNISSNASRYKDLALNQIAQSFGSPDGGNYPWHWHLKRILFNLFPCFSWLASYDVRKHLRDDIIAGITVGVMLVPQAMSYAKLAGLSPVYGLYTGLMPVFVYGLFGSSRQLAVGPVAIVSQLVHSGLLSMVEPGKGATAADRAALQAQYTGLAITLSLFVGLVECILGLLRLGWLIRFVSHSVISGFTSGAATTIALSQVKYFLGYSITSSNQLVPVVQTIFARIDQFKWEPFLMGVVMLGIIVGMRSAGDRSPRLRWCRVAGPLITVVAGTVFMSFVKTKAISTVGPIPKGFPPASTSHFQTNGHFSQLFLTSLMVTGVGILETVGIAKALASKNGYEINTNQELFGLGVANLVGSVFSAYPATGSFSRSAVSNEMGAKTCMSGLITGLLILCTLLFLTPLFKNLPNAVLGAVVIAACIRLFDHKEAIHLFKTNPRDFLLWLAACLGTIFLGIEVGVAIAVGLSLVFVIYESANPHMAILGRLPGTAVYRNIRQYPDAITYPGILIIRIDAPMYYANVSFIKDHLRAHMLRSVLVHSGSVQDPEAAAAAADWPLPGAQKAAAGNAADVRYVILDMSPVTYVDSTAIYALRDLHTEFGEQGVQLVLSNANKRVMVSLARGGLLELLGPERHFVRAHDAVQVCLARLKGESERRQSFDLKDLPLAAPELSPSTDGETDGECQDISKDRFEVTTP
ncbi:sulfate transporter [Klebsormidium nitens]|uniref:Sulfate transporter n=1 Tax=Klebsormidium nitens TaxID=105231 RepID=A0A1Y1HKQ1_KLENI|nr:sulfate transporter [Klebsormidium nitens]|eukprot:GAQ79180.1 sulfate transporter [Klebsormidium nitens]